VRGYYQVRLISGYDFFVRLALLTAPSGQRGSPVLGEGGVAVLPLSQPGLIEENRRTAAPVINGASDSMGSAWIPAAISDPKAFIPNVHPALRLWDSGRPP
jgi:hypothetical protein